MHKRVFTAALGVLAIPGLGFAAYGVAHSVSDSPPPQVILPANNVRPAVTPPVLRAVADDHGVDPATAGSVPGHDAGDDHGLDAARSATPGGHDAGDDHGVDTSTAAPTHDTRAEDRAASPGSPGPSPTTPTTPSTVDDHRHDATVTTALAPARLPSPPTTIDDHGGHRSGGGGSDDRARHH